MKSNQQLKKLLFKPSSIFELFHARTNLNKNTEKLAKDRKKALSLLPKRIYFKAYTRFKRVYLNVSKLPLLLKQALVKRQTVRSNKYDQKINILDLGTLLYYSAGLKYYRSVRESRRFYPSAGARFPLEVYLLTPGVKGLRKDCIYHYNVKEHSLESRITAYNLTNLFQQSFVKNSSAILIISGVFKRMNSKYSDRGYRYTLIECGHLGQNIYLVGAALNINVCAIGGFYDQEINQLLHIDGLSEAALYCFSLS